MHVEKTDAEQLTLEHRRDECEACDAEDHTRDRQAKAFAEDELSDVSRPSAEGHADGELTSTSLYQEGENTVNADGREHERLSLVNTRQPLKSRTYNLLEFRAEEGETSPTCSVYSSSSSPSESVRCGRCVGAEPTL